MIVMRPSLKLFLKELILFAQVPSIEYPLNPDTFAAVMYCNVYTTGDSSVIYINPNCNMKLIYEYLRVVTEVPDSKEIDLCTESGRLLGIYEAPCTANGLQYFRPRANYFVMTYDYVEGSGELSNLQPMMDYTNQDFVAVLARIKKRFGIPPTELIDDSDASLIFEHMLLAYQGNLLQLSEPDEFCPQKKSQVKKKRSHSIAHSTASLKSRGSKLSHEKQPEQGVLAQWREEKRAKLAALSAEETEENITQRRSSLNENDLRAEESRMVDEAIPEEDAHEHHLSEKAKEPVKIANHSKERKAAKKNPKKTGKEDAALQRAALNESMESLTTNKPSFRSLLTHSILQLYPPKNVDSSEKLKTSEVSASSFFVPLSDYCDTTKPAHPLTLNSIKKFFRDHPNDLSGLPKPLAADSNLEVPEKPKRIRKKKRADVKTKKMKTMVARPPFRHLRKRPPK